MADAFQRDVYCLLGLPFDAVDMAGAERRIRDAVLQRQPCFLSTPNLNFLVACLTDAEFRDSVIGSDLSIADGMPLVWMARLLGIPIRERVAGSGLFERLRRGTNTSMSVFFFGGMEGAAEAACLRLNAKPSGLLCVGYESPGFGSVEDMSSEATIAKINASNADFVLVSLSARKGQAWIARNRAQISAPVVSCLGATLNFVAGTVGRAPAWMQNSGLEWLWRIKEEPALWRRYFRDGLALLKLLVTRVVPYAWYLRHHKPDANHLKTASIETRQDGENCIVRLRGAWTQQNMAPLRDCLSRAVLAGKDVKLEVSDVTYADSAFVGLVMLLQGHNSQRGRQPLMGSLQSPVRRIVKYCCADFLWMSAG